MSIVANYFLFFSATFLIVIAPGPGMLFVISRGLAAGKKAGVISSLGTSTGILAHILAAGLGLTLFIQNSEIGFQLLKWAGVFYLLFLAWKAFSPSQNSQIPIKKYEVKYTSLFWQGALVNMLNPKVALFFLAFLPQFILPDMGSIPMQMAALGAIFMLLTLIVFTGYGLGAGYIRKLLIERPRVNTVIDWITGSLFVMIGIRLAMSVR